MPLRTLSIPYIKGDTDGSLTAELIRAVAHSGCFCYVSSGGGFRLEVKLIELDDENVGFRYDHKKSGKRRKVIVPTETRARAEAVLSLIETASGRCVIGPISVTAYADFDHFYYGHHEVNTFSLGQLTDTEGAHTAALRPLNKKLAEQIIEILYESSGD